jgi:putative hydrolase of the HAD superfamily
MTASSRPGDHVIRSVMFDFGGVITSSPFDAFGRYEQEEGLPDGFIRRVNATNPDDNAWARLERGQVDLRGFADAFEAEALALGHQVDALVVLDLLQGDVRPEMVEAVRRCSERFRTACLTNNFHADETVDRQDVEEIYALFDVVLESRTLGVRKPDPRFYQLACDMLDVEPDEVVYLDDLGVNLKPARAMGMRTIKVTTAGEALAYLSELTGIPLDGPPG